MPKAYIVPIATCGFVAVDPVSNPVRYAVEDERGRMVFAYTYPTVKQAKAVARSYGYDVQD